MNSFFKEHFKNSCSADVGRGTEGRLDEMITGQRSSHRPPVSLFMLVL